MVGSWVEQMGLDLGAYGTRTLRRTKPTLIYKRTQNLRAVQLPLGHTKLESAVRYPGIEVGHAREMAEQTEVWSRWTSQPGQITSQQECPTEKPCFWHCDLGGMQPKADRRQSTGLHRTGCAGSIGTRGVGNALKVNE